MASGQRVGYIRVSTPEQQTERQLDGVELDKTFHDEASAKDTNRPALQEMLRYVREGDTLIVHSMDRLARNVIDLMQLVERLTKQGVKVEFRKENLTFTGDDTPMSQLMLQIMGAVAQFERSILHARQREGIEIARRKGLYKGRKPRLSPSQIGELRERAAKGEKKTALARDYKLCRQTLYDYLGKEVATVATGGEVR